MTRPNPWVWVPVVFGFGVGAVIGWVVTGLTCLPDGCLGWQVLSALAVGLGAAVGVLVVAVLAIRSFEEWHQVRNRDHPPRSPGCEAPQDSSSER
jgi:hypothetical protein